MEKFDRRRKYYVILDCETATLPYASDLPESLKKQVAIAKPLIYDLGWTIVDKKGNVYARENYLISEIFSVPSIFNTAYYAEKRPLYIDKLNKGELAASVAKISSDSDLREGTPIVQYSSLNTIGKTELWNVIYQYSEL